MELDAVWQLVGISGWFIEFLERLMKECVLASSEDEASQTSDKESVSSSLTKDEDDDLFGPTTREPGSFTFDTQHF